MDMREIVEQLLHEDRRQIKTLTNGCGSCRRFVHQLRRKPNLSIGWDDIPQPLLERLSARLHQRLFWY